MARKRLIAPEFFTHGDLYDAEARTNLPLRVAFAGLWTQADRRGYFRWKPRELKMVVLPYDNVDFGSVLATLERAGFVARHEYRGEDWGRLRPGVLNAESVVLRSVRRLRVGRVSFPAAFRLYILARDGGRCAACGSPHDLQIDHITPVVFGGSNDASNLQALCADCNREKGPRAYAGRRRA